MNYSLSELESMEEYELRDLLLDEISDIIDVIGKTKKGYLLRKYINKNKKI